MFIEIALKFVKGLLHVPYEAALKQLRLFFLTHRPNRPNSYVQDYPWSLKIPHYRPPSHIQPANGYAATPTSSTDSDVVHAVANSNSPFGVFHFGTNYRLR